MHRFLYISLLTLALVIGVAGAAPATNAQQGNGQVGDSCTEGTSCVSGVCTAGKCTDYNATAPAADTTTTQTDNPADTTSVKDANTGQGNQTAAPVISDETGAIGGMMVALMTIFAWLLGVAAMTLDNAVYYTVITMGDYVSKLSAIGVTWRILRDISNIALIFGFLAIGISTILNSERFGYGTKMLPNLIMAAVFLNFSLFFTEAIIDGGNLFATQFYTQINGGVPARPINPLNPKEIVNEGISQKIMSQLGLQTIYSNALTNTFVLKAGNTILIGFMGIILFIVAAFVMFSLAFILIARFIILIFLIILAPIGVAGFAIPQLSSASKTWRDKLIEQTITAPVLLLILYIALAIITDAQFLGFGETTGDWTGFVDNNGKMNLAGFASSMLSFLVAMGLLLAVVVYSKKLSAFGADVATKWAGRATFGVTAFGASAFLNSGSRLARWGIQRTGSTGRLARTATHIARYGERARLDVRSIPGIGTGLALGGAGEAAKPIAKSAGGRVRQASDWWQKTGQESDRQYQQETVIPRLNAAVQASLQTGDYRQVSTILSSMSDKDFETGSAQRALINNPVAAALLSKARFEKIQQSEAISDARKAEITQARRNGDDPAHVRSRFNMDAANIYGPTLPNGTPHPFAGMTHGEALISGMNTSARGQLGGNVLTENTAPAGAPPVYAARLATLNLLNGSDFDAIRRAGEIAPAQRDAIGIYVDNVMKTLAITGRAPNPREASIIAAAAAPAFRSYYNLP